MELLVFGFQRAFFIPQRQRYKRNERPTMSAPSKNVCEEYHAAAAGKVPRRLLLQSVGFCPILSHVVRPVLAAPLLQMKEAEAVWAGELSGGVRVQEIIEGQGPEAHEGDSVEVNYVCRRSNGYFVHSTVDQFSGESIPVILSLDEQQTIKGLKEVLVGMRVGGKRRALVPPAVGYVNENLKPIPYEFGPRRSLLSHAKEPLVFEVQLLRVL